MAPEAGARYRRGRGLEGESGPERRSGARFGAAGTRAEVRRSTTPAVTVRGRGKDQDDRAGCSRPARDVPDPWTWSGASGWVRTSLLLNPGSLLHIVARAVSSVPFSFL